MKKLLLPLSYLLVIVATVLGTLAFTQGPLRLPRYKLQELEMLLTRCFVDGAESKPLQDAAAYAMVEALGDRWSYYIPQEEYDAYVEQKKNAYVGVGMTLTKGESRVVAKVVKGGPADMAGVQPGDVIVAVNDTRVTQMTTDELSGLVRGPEGTSLTMTVLRGEEEIALTMQRRTIRTAVATGVMLEDGIGLVTIENFNENCYKETMAAVEQLQKQGLRALIFDVRYNGGGYKHELEDVLDALLPEGVLFRSEHYTGKTEVDESDARCLEMPMAVLVNSESYSAAEFFAAALQEYDWAEVVGTQTQGKGHYQETYLLSDGSAVGISTGRYCTPKGTDLEGVGITPDIVVEVDALTDAKIYAKTLDPMEDPQILAALNALKTAK